MTAGDVFRLRDDAVEGRHPWVVLSDPHGDPPVVVIGNFTAYEPNKDQSCIVEIGDEPCLSKKSLFSYRDAKIVKVSDLEGFMRTGTIAPSGRLSQATLSLIYEGAAVTSFIANDPLEVLESLGLIPTE